MTWEMIINRIQIDLNVKKQRAKKFTNDFRKVYKGYKDAIQEVTASFTNDGRVQITCKINGNPKKYII